MHQPRKRKRHKPRFQLEQPQQRRHNKPNDQITSHQWLDRHNLPQHKQTTTQSLINQQLHKWSSMSNNHNRHRWRNLLTFSTLFILPLQCAYTLYKVHPTKSTAGHTSNCSTHNAPHKNPHIVHHKATPLGKASPHHNHHIARLRTTTTNATTTQLKAQLRNSRPLPQHRSSQHITTKLHNQHDHNMCHPQTPMCSYHVSTTT